MRAPELHFPVVLFISRLRLWIEKYFPAVLFVMLYKIKTILTFEYGSEILKCGYFN